MCTYNVHAVFLFSYLLVTAHEDDHKKIGEKPDESDEKQDYADSHVASWCH